MAFVPITKIMKEVKGVSDLTIWREGQHQINLDIIEDIFHLLSSQTEKIDFLKVYCY